MTNLAVVLPSNIVYVAGYVNDVVTIFTQDVFNLKHWRAAVEVASDSRYHIVLEMHDEAGNVGYFDEVIEYFLPVFIFDRTQEDVNRANELRKIGWEKMTEEQRTEWMSGLKGCMNTADLKRIENNLFVIAQQLNVDMQTNRDNLPDIPNELYFQVLLANVEKLRALGYIHHDTPKVPSMPLNSFEKLNDVERILHDIYEIYLANNSCALYCGTEIYAGEGSGIL